MARVPAWASGFRVYPHASVVRGRVCFFPGAAVSIRGAARHRVLRCPGLGPTECAAAAPFAGRLDRVCVTAWDGPTGLRAVNRWVPSAVRRPTLHRR
jgi:hypothetical protein